MFGILCFLDVCSLGEEVAELQEQLRLTQVTHTQELAALRHQHSDDLGLIQERSLSLFLPPTFSPYLSVQG